MATNPAGIDIPPRSSISAEKVERDLITSRSDKDCFLTIRMSLYDSPLDPGMSAGFVDEEQTSVSRIVKDEVVVVDGIVPTQMSVEPDSRYWCKSKRYFFWILLILGLVCAALGVTLLLVYFRDNEDVDSDQTAYDRQGYYEYLHSLFLPLTGSPQEQAIEWLAFHDTPLKGGEQTRVMQRFALVVVYFNHGGPTTWTSINDSPSGWIANGGDMHECQWRGVDCNASNEVTALRLPAGEGIALTGSSLASEVGLLTSLQYFNAANQRLQGTIPSDWEALTNLIMLDMSNNQIRSTIPSFMGSFSNLQSLMLGGNFLTGHFPETLLESGISEFRLCIFSSFQ